MQSTKEKNSKWKKEQKEKEKQKQKAERQNAKSNKKETVCNFERPKCYCLSHLRASRIQRFFLLFFLCHCSEMHFGSRGTKTFHFLTVISKQGPLRIFLKPKNILESLFFCWHSNILILESFNFWVNIRIAIYYLYYYCLLLLIFLFFFRVKKFLKERNICYFISSCVINKIDDLAARKVDDDTLQDTGLGYDDIKAFRSMF